MAGRPKTRVARDEPVDSKGDGGAGVSEAAASALSSSSPAARRSSSLAGRPKTRVARDESVDSKGDGGALISATGGRAASFSSTAACGGSDWTGERNQAGSAAPATFLSGDASLAQAGVEPWTGDSAACAGPCPPIRAESGTPSPSRRGGRPGRCSRSRWISRETTDDAAGRRSLSKDRSLAATHAHDWPP